MPYSYFPVCLLLIASAVSAAFECSRYDDFSLFEWRLCTWLTKSCETDERRLPTCPDATTSMTERRGNTTYLWMKSKRC